MAEQTDRALEEETLCFELRAAQPLAPPPSVDAMVARRRPFAAMTEGRFTDVQGKLAEVKCGIDGISDRDWRVARDRVFPLDRSGSGAVGATQFANRAGHKLHQTMEATGVWPFLVGYLGDARAARRKDNEARAPPKPAQAAPAAAATNEDDGDSADGAAPAGKKHREEPGPHAQQPAKQPAHHSRPHRVAFLDVCGGPGAFSQCLYTAKPKGVELDGFGLTLMDHHVGAPEGWYPDLHAKFGFRACFGVDGTGNVYDRANVEGFVSLVRDRPVRLVVADGGFEVTPSRMNLQEAIMAQITFAQFYVAARTLRPGGCFVLKLFDVFTTFNASMLWLCGHFWDRVVIVKPKHSRAVNSERYLACLGYKGCEADAPGDAVALRRAWLAYLKEVHARGFTDDTAVSGLVDPARLDADAAFWDAMSGMVTTLAGRQQVAIGMVLDQAKANASSRDATTAAALRIATGGRKATVVEATTADGEKAKTEGQLGRW